MRLSFPHPLMKWDRGVCEEPTLVWWKNQVKPKNKTNFGFNRVCEEQIVSFSVFNTYMETSRNLANTHHAAHVEQRSFTCSATAWPVSVAWCNRKHSGVHCVSVAWCDRKHYGAHYY